MLTFRLIAKAWGVAVGYLTCKTSHHAGTLSSAMCGLYANLLFLSFKLFLFPLILPPPALHPVIIPSPRWLWGWPVWNVIGVIPFSLIASVGERLHTSHRVPVRTNQFDMKRPQFRRRRVRQRMCWLLLSDHKDFIILIVRLQHRPTLWSDSCAIIPSTTLTVWSGKLSTYFSDQGTAWGEPQEPPNHRHGRDGWGWLVRNSFNGAQTWYRLRAIWKNFFITKMECCFWNFLFCFCNS